MNSIKVYSFDIFDTLLLRPFIDPQEVWAELEMQEGAAGFAKARKKADEITYKLGTERGGETTIEEAYDILPIQYKPLMKKEMDLERKVLHTNPEMVAEWQRLGEEGKTRVLISDMYLPKDFLESVLKEKGIDGWNKFYLSRDYNARKTTGALFKVLLDDFKISPSEVLHVGDNLWSDIRVPQQLGMQVKHYQKVTEQYFQDCPFARSIDANLAATLAIGWQNFKYDHKKTTYWNRLGFNLGGVLGYLYVSWILQVAQQLGIKRLLFIARDGYIWQKICEVLCPEIRTEYIYAPRLVSIAVNGVIGTDPCAMENRRQYIATHLKAVDTRIIKQEYSDYVRKLQIDETCAIVDGCSSAFSAQNLIESCSGRPIFGFYLLAMASREHIGALFQSKLYSLPFQMISEFLFGSPEPPIIGVKENKPIYSQSIASQESFKMSVSKEIAEGVVACAKLLKTENIRITPEQWIHFCDQFMASLTEEDKSELSKANNAADVEQNRFCNVIYIPHSKFELHFIKRKFLIIGINLKLKDNIYIIKLDKKRFIHLGHQYVGYNKYQVFHD